MESEVEEGDEKDMDIDALLHASQSCLGMAEAVHPRGMICAIPPHSYSANCIHCLSRFKYESDALHEAVLHPRLQLPLCVCLCVGVSVNA